MVKLGPFQVELVEAQSGRRFTEHTSEDGNTYFESEPDAEYFISMKKVDLTPTEVAFKFKVDGQHLGVRQVIRNKNPKERKYGLSQREGTVGYHKALKFVKPPKGDFKEYNDNDGTIEIKLYEAEVRRNADSSSSDSKKNWNMTIKQASDRGLRPFNNDKKHVRSAEGSTTTAAKHFHMGTVCKRGRHLGTYVIHYCSVEKLVSLGVLPRCPTTSSGSMRRRAAAAAVVSPLSSLSSSSGAPPLVRQPKRIRMESPEINVIKEYDLYDLTGEDSDDDDDDNY